MSSTPPVSWLLIEPGWRVEAADGTELGHVEEVAGDSGADIFDGLSIGASASAHPRYVPAEQVGEIVDGRVRLKLDSAAFGALGEFTEAPIEHRERIGIVRRALEWLGLAGRR